MEKIKKLHRQAFLGTKLIYFLSSASKYKLLAKPEAYTYLKINNHEAKYQKQSFQRSNPPTSHPPARSKH